MSRNEVLEKISDILRDVLDEPDMEVNEELNRDACEEWDSIGHMTLMATLESEFGIRFTMEELLQIKSVEEIVNRLLK